MAKRIRTINTEVSTKKLLKLAVVVNAKLLANPLAKQAVQ